jgi:N-methylhydantoinase B/oxoprolinase/acetone carboxylase alpha subunit
MSEHAATDHPALDAIGLEVTWNRLISIAEEAEHALVRTSFSTVISEARDFACIVLDADGHSIATAPMTIPAFSLALPVTVAEVRRRFGEDGLAPGDVLIVNDPWHATGHLSDISIIRPLFRSERLIGFAAATGHVSDIGGVVGYHSGRDLFEEGLHIPFSKLFDRGRRDETMWSLIAVNVRVPDLVLGDIEAMVAATEVASGRVDELLDDIGLETLAPISEAIGTRASQAMRDAIAALPDGEHRGMYEFDGYERPVALRVTITVDGDAAHVDFTGTDPQVSAGAINAPFVISRADVYYFFQYVLTPEVPACSALFEPIAVTAPEGTVVSPTFPAAVKARSKTTFHIPEALFQAVEPLLGDRIQAASGHSCYVILNGRDERDRAFNSFYLPGGGMGAASVRDGLDCTLFPTNTTITPVEVLECTAPVVVLEKRVLPDSGGPGRWRGGCGQRVTLQSVGARPMTVTLRPEDRRRPPVGLRGGQPGGACEVWLNGARTDADLLELRDGDQLAIHTAGGGGVGSPEDRPDELIQADLASGRLTEAGATAYRPTEPGDAE